MGGSKIHFSEEEMMLLQNADILLTKNRIIEKVYGFFGELSKSYHQAVLQCPEPYVRQLCAAIPKISRGENFGNLPYVMLDYPRNFGRENVCAVRTFFWWGKFLSLTLHLKGEYQQRFGMQALMTAERAGGTAWKVSRGTNEWDHNLDSEDYELLGKLGQDVAFVKNSTDSYLKIATFYPLHQWREAEERFPEVFRQILRIFSTQLPSR